MFFKKAREDKLEGNNEICQTKRRERSIHVQIYKEINKK